MSIAQSLLDVVFEEAQRNDLERVTVVSVRIGAMAAVVPDSLQFCYQVLTEGTVADGSELRIEEIRAVAWCPSCENRFETTEALALCPQCGGPAAVNPAEGRDLTLTGIEGETGGERDGNADSGGAQHPAGQ